MKKLILFIVLAALCLFLKVNGQFYKPSDKTIRIGETLPSSFYQTIHQAVNAKTGEQTTLKLDRYKDKLIILDFWATWCKPCIYSLNKLDSTQKAMNRTDFLVIPVTYQKATDVITFLKKMKWDFISITGDTTLAKIFSHVSIPHQVWVKDGKVFTIPKPLDATAENITQVLSGKTPSLRLNIQDNSVDPLKPLFAKGNGETGLYYKGKHAVIARYLPNYGTSALKFLKQKDTSILYTYNISLRQLFYEAFEKEIFPGYGSSKGLVWKVSDQFKVQFINRPGMAKDSVSTSIKEQWIAKNSYGYNLRYPKNIDKDKALKLMQKDLNVFFGIYLNIKASIQSGPKEKYLVLRLKGSKTDSESTLKSKTNNSTADQSGNLYRYTNMLFKQQFLSRLSLSKLVTGLTLEQVIDSTGIAPDFKGDFAFSKDINRNLTLAQKELARYGMYLTVEEKQVPVLLIEEKTSKAPLLTQ